MVPNAGGALMSGLIDFFTDPAHWSGSDGIPRRLFEHLQISGVSILIALVPAVLLGLYIGHTRRFELVVSVANLGRALPSFAVMAFFFPIQLRLGLGLSSWAAVVAMVLLAVPPILTNTYVGVRDVDRDTLEAARGMGMSESEVLRSIELPLAVPLAIAGLRTAAVQVVATATLAALIAGGGLGRYIVDGFALGPNSEKGVSKLLAGAVLVALLAILTDAFLALVERALSPRTTSSGRRRVPEEHLEVAPAPDPDRPS